jgi:ankyrin repeat protein
MYFRMASYVKVLILIILLGPCLYLRSQVIIPDTSLYNAFLTGPDVQSNLNFALQQAASLGNSMGIEWLLNHGADIDTRTYQNVTPLMFAVAAGEKEAVATLLKYDPELDFFSTFNESPLMVAVKDDNLDIAELLLRDSANVNLQDKRGNTALHLASIYGFFYMTDMLLYYEADPDIRAKDGTTPLMVAVFGGFADLADLLLQNRAHVLDSDNDGFTALMIAAQFGDTLLTDLLLKRGADIHAINKYKYDALDLAIKLNHPETVEFLFRKGYFSVSSGKDPIDPYTVATIYGRKNIIDILRKSNLPEAQRKGFNQISLAASVKVCFHDLYTGFSVTTREPINHFGIIAGFDMKPAWSRVIVKQTDVLYYQYMDKSYLAYAGVLKELNLSDNATKGNWFFTGSVAAGYSFGNKYKGTEIKPESRVRIIPAAGFRYNKNNFNFQIGLEYTNTELYKIGPVWLRTGISFNLDFENFKGPAKVLRW